MTEAMTGGGAIAMLADEWDELADRLEAPPHLRPGWFNAWAEAFAGGEIVPIVTRQAGRLTGVLPLERRRGSLRALANYHSPGFGALSESDEVTRQLTDEAVSCAGRRLELTLIDSDGALATAVKESARAAGRRVLERPMQRTPVVRVSEDWNAWHAALGRGFRKELRRLRRRLDEMGVVEMEVSDGSNDLGRRLEEIFQIEATGWKADRGTAILSRPETRAFYEQVGAWAARIGALRLFVLRLDGRPVAVDYALESGRARYMLKGGFDPELARVGPGGLLLEDGLRHAFDAGLECVELGGGDDEYKLRWTETVRVRSIVQVFSRTPAGFADFGLHRFGRPLAVRLRRESGE